MKKMISSKKIQNLFTYISITCQHFQHPYASNRTLFEKGTPMIALTRNFSDLGGILSAIDVVRPAIDGIINFSIDREKVDHIEDIN